VEFSGNNCLEESIPFDFSFPLMLIGLIMFINRL
jgi:hypothetical protein